ncbi:Coatomer, gamma subunit [Wallemia mellicola]|nr:Coatomer, gamma subunit [Wallemia mellicola]
MSLKKNEEITSSNSVGSFYQDKTAVFQEARIFNQSPISPRKSRILLTKLAYLLSIGETFSKTESTSLFFSVTKLFQNKDPALRQMVYLVVKELSSSADDVIMATSSIMKDIQPNLDVIYRPNAIRALSRVTDPSMIQGLERFFRTALVDKSPSISAAALVSSYHLYPEAKDIIKRWANEVTEALSKPEISRFSLDGSWQSTSAISQYHALALLYTIRDKDRMAVTKLVQGLATPGSSSLRNPLALCMLVRYAARLMDEDPNLQRPMLELLEGWLRNKSDMVSIEAARAICDWKGAKPNDLMRPIAVLQLALSTPKTPLKFAAIRTLNRLAQVHPQAVAACNLEMENLITDSNRSIATFAITTLLKTGNEASVDRLMKQISGFMLEISDEFKVIVVDAVRALCLKFPSKHVAMLGFLSGALRDEGGYDFKRAVVDAIFDMIKYIEEPKETALSHLCEFIEDCEFTKLSVRVLHLLGVEGPKTLEPTKYIRHIYNRVVLENAIVRAAAVSSLAKFGVNVVQGAESVRRSVKVLLGRCLDDIDDEVRDRAAMYMRIIEDDELASRTVKDDSTYSIGALESKLVAYVNDPSSSAQAFDASAIPRVNKEQIRIDTNKAIVNESAMGTSTPDVTQSSSPAPTAAASKEDTTAKYAEQIANIPEFATYGPILQSSSNPVELTERETEYVVSAIKHVFASHIVFQFNVQNTIAENVLEDVSVIMQPTDDLSEQVQEDFIMPVQQLTSEMGSTAIYVSFTRVLEEEYPLGSFINTLSFISKEVDPDTGDLEPEGYKDEYQIEDIELQVADYVQPSYASFGNEWEKHTTYAATETFSLTALDSLQLKQITNDEKAACDSLVELLNMEALGGSQNATNPAIHTMELSGLVCGGAGKALARARMAYEEDSGVTLEFSVRAESQNGLDLIINAIQ